MSENLVSATYKGVFDHKSCVTCEGIFLLNEPVHIDILNQSYCDVCFKEVKED